MSAATTTPTPPNQLTSQVKLLHKVALLSQDGLALLLRRSEDASSRPNKWDLPGGNAEWPDSKDFLEIERGLHEHDITREIVEETGLEVFPELLSLAPVFLDTTFQKEKDVYTIIIGWKVKLSGVSTELPIKLSAEHSEYRWTRPEEINTFDYGFAGGDFGFITLILRRAFGE